MSVAREVRLWAAHRATAVVLAFCVLVHLVTIIYAVRAGLTATQVLERTRASVGWAAFYGVFVVAAAVHTGIGLRNIASEWLGWRGPRSRAAIVAFALFLAAMGARAVWAVFA